MSRHDEARKKEEEEDEEEGDIRGRRESTVAGGKETPLVNPGTE